MNTYLSYQNPDSLFAIGKKLLEEDHHAAAMDSFVKASSYYESAGSFLDQGRVLLAAGKAFRNIEPQKAYAFYLKARNVLDSAGFQDNLLYGELNQEMGYLHMKQRNYPEAIREFNRIISMQGTDKDLKVIKSKAFNNLGILYYYQGNYDTALDCFEKSVAIKKQILSSGDPLLINSYINTGVVYINLGDYDKALEYLSSAEKGMNVSGAEADDLLSTVLMNKGVVFRRQGDYEKTKMFFTRVRNIYIRDSVRYADKLASLYLNLAIAEMDVHHYQEALTNLIEGRHIGKLSNSRLIPKIDNLMARAYSFTGQTDLAKIKYMSTIKSAERNKYSLLDLAAYYMNYGIFLTDELHKPDEGLNFYKKALEIYKKKLGVVSYQTANILANIGALYATTGNYESALEYYQQALMSFKPGFNDSAFIANPEYSQDLPGLGFLSILKRKATALDAYYHKSGEMPLLKASFATYEECISLIERLRLNYEDDESRLILSSAEAETFSAVLQTAFELYKLTGDDQYKQKAFIYAEKGKSAILLAGVRGMEARDFGGVPRELIDREFKLKKKISFYDENIYEEKKSADPDANKILLWENKLFVLNQQYDSLLQKFEHDYPDYYALKYKTGVISAGSLMQQLDSTTCLVEFVYSDSVVYSFWLTHDKFNIESKQVSQRVQNDLAVIHKNLVAPELSKHTLQDYQKFTAALHSLYGFFFQNSNLNKNIEQLLVVNDEKFAYIPFEILLNKKADSTVLDYRHLPYLFRKYDIGYAYSATLLFDSTRKSTIDRSKLLAFAPEYPSTGMKRPDKYTLRQQYREDLYPLPGALDEAKNVASLTNGRIFTGKEATERNFKRYAGRYDLIHLAMHAVINNKNPMYSKLVFTANNDSAEDGLLNTYEVYNMQLKARMAVLSSCNSGKGKQQKGEGIMSMARAFLYAGCPSIVMSLWEVEDKSGIKLMTDFYQNLQNGENKIHSLAMAKKDFINSADMLTAHPYFWSGYEVIGNPGPVFSNKSAVRINWMVSLGGTISIFLLVIIFMKLRR
ncbi:MAG TPA: CHAT domain-containing tetratricopeptide repeat protein [Bacteroidales bacterium]|nr:CHAT domain-containing tetratricopeptide repeat protein [Bacteroidales bacterium]